MFERIGHISGRLISFAGGPSFWLLAMIGVLSLVNMAIWVW